uniref:Oogenesis-related gene n=1 Tax=Gasterosteus aculeatus aculeatus TaxID=481459 RepID=G3PGJ0_GASAC|nr:oogenesis-related [Gasterosteus aculeatus aculeatus]
MTSTDIHRDTAEELEQPEKPESTEAVVVAGRDGVLRSMLRGLLWPFGLLVRAYRGVWWALGFRRPAESEVAVVVVADAAGPPAGPPAVSSPARQSLAGRKRLHRATRMLLSVLPRWVQGALGYPVSSSIGCSLSPEIRYSPTKPCGKGSKRKQDELYDDDDDDDEEEENQTWVEALNLEYADDDDAAEDDPNYEPSTVETESEEYCSHNSTESDIELEGKCVVIEDVDTGIEICEPSEGSGPAVVS